MEATWALLVSAEKEAVLGNWPLETAKVASSLLRPTMIVAKKAGPLG